MMLHVACPQCNQLIRIPESTLGQQARCPACAATFPTEPPPEERPVEAARPRPRFRPRQAGPVADPASPRRPDAVFAGDAPADWPASWVPAVVCVLGLVVLLAAPLAGWWLWEERGLTAGLLAGVLGAACAGFFFATAATFRASRTARAVCWAVSGAVILLLAVALVGVLIPAGGGDDLDGWRPFVSDEGRFQVLMPSSPECRQQINPDSVMLTLFIARQARGSAEFMVLYGDIPTGELHLVPLEARFDAAREEMLRGAPGARVLNERRIELNGHPGRELEVEIPSQGTVTNRIYIVGQRLYVVAAGGKRLKPQSPQVQQFFASFQATTDGFDLNGTPPAGVAAHPSIPELLRPPHEVAGPVAPPNVPTEAAEVARPPVVGSTKPATGVLIIPHTGTLVQTLLNLYGGEGHGLALAPNGKWLAVGSREGMLRLYEGVAAVLRVEVHAHQDHISTLAFSPNSRLLASGCFDGQVKVWDLGYDTFGSQPLKERLLLKHGTRVRHVAFSPASDLLASVGNDRAVRLWDVQTGKTVRVLTNHPWEVTCVAFAPDGKTLLVGMGNPGGRQFLKVWDVASGTELMTPEGPTNAVWDVAFTPRGCLAASASYDGTVRLWDTIDWQPKHTLSAKFGQVWTLALSPSHHLLAAGHANGTVSLWDITSGRQMVAFRAHDAAVWTVIISPQSKLLITGSDDRSVKVWNLGQLLPRGRMPARLSFEPPAATELPGLLGYWPFDEGSGTEAADASGKNNRAAVRGAVWVAGVRGGALDFDGVAAFVDYGTSKDFNFAAGAPFTFSGWVRTKGDRGAILSQRHLQDGGADINITLEGGRLCALVRSDGRELGGHARVIGPPVNDGTWHHFALTRNGSTIELSVDGVSQGAASHADAGGPITTNLRAIGAERYWALRGGGFAYVHATIDEVCIFGRVLTEAEIRWLAGQSGPVFGIDRTPQPPNRTEPERLPVPPTRICPQAGAEPTPFPAEPERLPVPPTQSRPR